MTAMKLGVALIVIAIILIMASIPLLMRKVPMNRWYGARFKQSYASDEHWYAINVYSAKQLIWWSALLLALGVITFFLDLEDNSTLFTALLFAPLLMLVPMLLSYRFARRRA